jgi:hypothetical protein
MGFFHGRSVVPAMKMMGRNGLNCAKKIMYSWGLTTLESKLSLAPLLPDDRIRFFNDTSGLV